MCLNQIIKEIENRIEEYESNIHGTWESSESDSMWEAVVGELTSVKEYIMANTKVKVSQEVAEALDRQGKDEWTKQFNLISHCKNFSGNGICMDSNYYVKEAEILNTLQPLDFAKCLILGYERKEDIKA